MIEVRDALKARQTKPQPAKKVQKIEAKPTVVSPAKKKTTPLITPVKVKSTATSRVQTSKKASEEKPVAHAVVNLDSCETG